MTWLLLCFSIGIIIVAYLPALPSLIAVLLVALIFCILLFAAKKKPLFLQCLCVFLIGMSYAIFAGQRLLSNQLTADLSSKEISVEGEVVDLPQEDKHRQLFALNVSAAYLNQQTITASFPTKIMLSSYGGLRVKTGEHWRLLVKLKPPRGFVNPQGFDYHALMLRRGVGATGYIRDSDENKLLAEPPRFSIGVLRYQWQQWLINTSTSPQKGILIALLVGNTSYVDKNQWGEMINTGTNHLIAISGLHLGFFAIVGWCIGYFIGRFIHLIFHRCTASLVGHFFALALTVVYSLLAGLNIPTLRTLIMLAVVQILYCLRRNFSVTHSLALAWVAVLLYDPLATYDIGFWLSFLAVAMLIFCFAGRLSPQQNNQQSHLILRVKLVQSITEFIHSQWVMFIGLFVPLAILVHSSSLLAPAANLLAIPVITFFVVPCLILAAVVQAFSDAIALVLLHAAEQGLTLVHAWLHYLLVLAAGNANPVVYFNPLAIGLAVLAVFVLLLPRGLGNKWLAAFALLLSLVIPSPRLPALQVLVFDVGQGTALFIRTPHHQLLYDVGPLYTDNFDAGSGIIVPYLQSQGLRRIDTIIVSHNDQDHSGGLAGVLAATSVDQLYLGEPDKYRLSGDEAITSKQAARPNISNCHEVSPWQWDEVNFQFVTWDINPTAKPNNHSCVLLIEYQGHRLLLTGDIEKEVEYALLASEKIQPVEILLAPHHGSHTSSTVGFVEATHPAIVVYSAGYHNKFGHPHRDVRARYQAVSATEVNTAWGGAQEFVWGLSGQELLHVQYRQKNKRYWFEPVSELNEN